MVTMYTTWVLRRVLIKGEPFKNPGGSNLSLVFKEDSQSPVERILENPETPRQGRREDVKKGGSIEKVRIFKTER